LEHLNFRKQSSWPEGAKKEWYWLSEVPSIQEAQFLKILTFM